MGTYAVDGAMNQGIAHNSCLTYGSLFFVQKYKRVSLLDRAATEKIFPTFPDFKNIYVLRLVLFYGLQTHTHSFYVQSQSGLGHHLEALNK